MFRNSVRIFKRPLVTAESGNIGFHIPMQRQTLSLGDVDMRGLTAVF